jgi:acyl-homoserine lactone acylase PvdQ
VGRPLLPWLPLPGNGTLTAPDSVEWGTGNAADNCAGVPPNTPARTCYLADTDLPSGVNPSKGYFATANSDPIGVSDDNNPLNDGPYLSFDWDDSTAIRYGRIAKLLKDNTTGGKQVSLDTMVAIQSDHVVSAASQFLPALNAVPLGSQTTAFKAGLTILNNWNANGLDCPTGLQGIDPNGPADTDALHVANSAACLLFHDFLRNLLHRVFDDDLNAIGVQTDVTFAVRGMVYMLQPSTPEADTTFCNNVGANGALVAAHTCLEQIAIQLDASFNSLSAALGAPPTNWLWGRTHTLTIQSSAAPLVADGFQAGPFARPGGAATVDVGQPFFVPSSPRSFAYNHGSVVRYIAEMDSTSPVIKMQSPGPQRDVPFDQITGPNLLVQYVQNQYFDLTAGPQIDSAGAVVQVQNFSGQ